MCAFRKRLHEQGTPCKTWWEDDQASIDVLRASLPHPPCSKDMLLACANVAPPA